TRRVWCVSSARLCLWLGSRWGGARRHVRTACPHQHFPIFIHSEPLALNEFGLQVLQIVVIQVELALEGSIRQAPAALQEGNRLIKEFLKGHHCPSTGCEACRIPARKYRYLLRPFVPQRAGKGKQEV